MNRESYNRIAAQWDQERRSLSARERRYVDALLENVPAHSALLDLGCGTGRPIAEYVLARGHDVTGVDQASELLTLARARFPQGTWIESRLEEFEPPRSYAGVICWDTLFHVPRAVHAAILSKIARALEAGGKVMLTVGGSDHPPFTDWMLGQQFFYDSHPPDAAVALVEQSGLEPLISEFIDLPTSGRDKGRYVIVARRSLQP